MYNFGLARDQVDNFGGTIRDLITGFFKEGDYITEFEKRFALYIGARYAIAACSGRHALEIILRGLKLKEGDEVIVPAYTFYIVPYVIKKMGLKPVFVDVSPKTANIEASYISKKITKKTKAIILTHLFGRPAQMQDILKAIKRRRIYIIEDACQALGAEYRGKKIGSFGKAGFFSLDTTKPVNTMGGGIITTNDEKLAKSMREEIKKLPLMPKAELLSRIKRSYKESLLTMPIVFRLLIWPLLLFSRYSKIDIIGGYQKSKNAGRMHVFKFSNIQAGMGIRQLEVLDVKNKKKADNSRLLIRELGNKVKFLEDDEQDFNIYTSFMILCNNKKELSDKLLLHGIDTDRKVMQNCGKMFSAGHFKNAELLDSKALKIPVYNWLTERQIKYMAKLIKRYAK